MLVQIRIVPKNCFWFYLLDQFVGLFSFRIDRKKDKTERKILDSQERAFWDVHRPVVRLIDMLLFYNWLIIKHLEAQW